ncbi:MAG TPA: RidA family protein [Telluria sp.]|jgi:reactive intermediate/imine deaminase
MKIEQVHTQPDPYAPYLLSQAIRVGNLLFVSGQAGYGADGAIVSKDFDQQADQAFRNLREVLIKGGSSLDCMVKVTIFLTEMQNFPKIVELRRTWFCAPYPADTIVEVSALYAPEAMIEIEAIALAEGEVA